MQRRCAGQRRPESNSRYAWRIELMICRINCLTCVITDSRSLLTASYRSLLHSYIASPPTQGPPQALLNLLHSPRARLVDLSYLDPTSGLSLLHEAARRKDLSLIDTCIKAGADVFVRDRRGKSVADSSSGSRDDKVKVFLRQCEPSGKHVHMCY